MATRGYITVIDPATGSYRARIVLSDAYPHDMVATLRMIWARTCHTDTPAMVEELMRHDWYVLGADITTDTDIGFPTDLAVSGVGVALTGEVAEHAPLVVDRAGLGQLEAQWIYLIDVARDAVSLIDAETMAAVASYSLGG